MSQSHEPNGGIPASTGSGKILTALHDYNDKTKTASRECTVQRSVSVVHTPGGMTMSTSSDSNVVCVKGLDFDWLQQFAQPTAGITQRFPEKPAPEKSAPLGDARVVDVKGRRK